MVGNKRSSTFFITVGPVSWSKSSIGDWFQNCGEFSQVAVGEENYSEKLDPDTGEVVDGVVGQHHHIFLRSVDKILLVDVREMVKLFTAEEEVSIDVETCRNVQNSLRYLSKEDKSPYLWNVPVSKLSLYARAWHHAKTRYRSLKPIDLSDPFVVAAGPHYRMVLNIIECHLKGLRDHVNRNRPRLDINYLCNQVYLVDACLSDGMSHLYLEGEPGVGKSEFIDSYLRDQVYYKVNDYNQYCFAGLQEYHRFLWFEDFDYEKWKIISATLLSIMDGKEVTVQAKYLPDRLTSFKLQVIFTSNFVLAGTSAFFQRRVKSHYWNHVVGGCTCGLPGDIDDIFGLSLA